MLGGLKNVLNMCILYAFNNCKLHVHYVKDFVLRQD